MPELPEVEALRLSLHSKIINQKIVDIKVFKSKLVSAKGTKRVENNEKVKEFITELTGEIIDKFERRAKTMILTMKSGKILLIHLKMTGQLVYKTHNSNDINDLIMGGHPIKIDQKDHQIDLPSKHSHIIFTLEKGKLFFNDTRMFGYLLYYPNMQSVIDDNHFDKNLSLEPLNNSFNYEDFSKQFKILSGTVKKNFLEQKVVVGLGNIYADEVCFFAGVRPTRTNKSLKEEELDKLYQGITTILPKAVEQGGSSVANYLLGDGSRGNYANFHKVYGRSGKDCFQCGLVLQSIKHAGRTTVYCINCQS
jgi:formamidopyrimidine-DNA glycosylase